MKAALRLILSNLLPGILRAAQSEGMKTSLLVAGILAAGMTVYAKDSKPPDVTVYAKGDRAPPSSVDQEARSTATWMFARMSVRIVWRDGEPAPGAAPRSPVTIQIRWLEEAPAGVSAEALARALPFGEQGAAIDIMYDRIRFVARRLEPGSAHPGPRAGA